VLLKKRLVPVSVYIETTNTCNANCVFCAYQFYNAKKTKMSLDYLKKLLNEMSLLKIDKVNLTPLLGEIFADNDIVEKLELVGSKNFKYFSTYTNLINIKEKDIERILNSGLTTIYISASPLDEGLYEMIYRSKQYKNFLNNLILLLDVFSKLENKTVKKIKLEFRSTMSLSDCQKLDDYRLIESLVTDDVEVAVMQTFDSWMGAIQKEDLIDGMMLAKPNGKKIIPCNRLNNIQVLANGDIRACGCRVNTNTNEDIFLIGNIDNISISDAYNSQKVIGIKKSFLRNNPPEECQKCSWYS
jgi:radical SAM protein with 4Fe4S-binding SPASM domain